MGGAWNKCEEQTKLQGKLPSSYVFFLGFHHADFCSNATTLRVVMTRSSLCFFVPMLEDTQVHDNEEFSDKELNFSSSRFFVPVLKVIQMHDDIEFCSSLSFLKNSNATGPKDTMRRSLAPYSHVFFLFKCYRSPRPQRGAQLFVIMFYCSSAISL